MEGQCVIVQTLDIESAERGQSEHLSKTEIDDSGEKA